MNIDFSDRVILLTGAAGGIGRATVSMLASAGAHVVCVDRDAGALEALADLAPTDQLTLLEVELTGVTPAQEVVKETLDLHQRLDALVHMSAILMPIGLEDVDEACWNDHMEVNINTTFFLARAAADAMKDLAITGRIILMSSGAWLSGGMATRLPYATTKGAVNTMSRGLAKAYGPYGITVNAVAPGLIDTPMMRSGLTDDERRRMEDATPLGRFGTPEEVASVVVFLASDAASFVSGATINVSGGFTLY